MSKSIKLAVFALFTATTVLASCQKDITYYTVTFDAKGGQLHGEAVITVAEGARVPDPGYTTPPEGYAQKGWFKEAELINTWDFYSDVVVGDMTLYAGWERLYTFTFYGNGGTFHNDGGGETWTVDWLRNGYQLPFPDNVIKPGYILEGWYKDAELTERWDFATDVVTGDGAVYAKWGPGIEGLTRANYPRVDGATSTRALNVMIACKLLGLPYTWRMIYETEEACVLPDGENFSADGSFLDGRIMTSQTHGAMMNLIDAKVDIILRSTTASPDEKAAAQAAGVTLIETPVALDAFVFMRNGANPVRSLTIEQIRKIYTKQITKWAEVGGNDAPMTVFTRPRNSGSEEAFRELVMNGQEPAEFPEEQQIFSMAGFMWEMERDANGIGYIFKNYKEMIMQRYEPVFAIDGVFPDAITMKNRTYPLTTEVYAIVRSDLDQGSTAYKLYEWLQSESSEIVLHECGFLSY